MSSSLISNVVLPVVGLGIVLFCILAFKFQWGAALRDKTQRIHGLGLELEVSVLTLFTLVGVVMAFSGIYLQLKGYEGQIKRYEGELRATREALSSAQKTRLTPLVTLEGVSATAMPKLEDVKSEYYEVGNERPVDVTVAPGVRSNQFRLILEVSPGTSIRSLVLRDRRTGESWAFELFAPFEPEYTLKRQGQ